MFKMRRGGLFLPTTGTLENEAYQKIKQAILARKLLPGSRLSEPALAKQLKISRTPVRAAIKRLMAEGLAEPSPTQGAVVALPSSRDIQEVVFMRETLEPVAAALAAEKATNESIVHLEELIFKEKEAFHRRDLKSYIEVNDEFHGAIARLSGNSLLEQSIKNLILRYDIFLALFDPIYELDEKELDSPLEHHFIVMALKEHDPQAAEAAMRYHLRSSRKYATLRNVENINAFPFNS